ncbi:MAG: hypothetical protein GVY25_15605 [Bacteroidetes bacterium]|jgi:hypothetical protein|nr:hypothetical protein [Bacteroidota bacterium]
MKVPQPRRSLGSAQAATRLSISALLIVIGWAACLTSTAAAQGPAPVTTIENGDADTRLQLNSDGGLYIPGAFVTDGTENDSIPAMGAGTRLMWYPAKGAFRVGRVGLNTDGTQWDAAAVGDYSTAFGLDTKASGAIAMAMGRETTASGFNATAMGRSTVASSFNATSMGRETTASGINATAMGKNTTAASDQSLTIGKYNSANTSSDLTLLVAGNGGAGSPSDALVLDQFGDLKISGTLTESSDRRLKTSIRPLKGETLAKLSRLRPVRYEFKNQETHPAGEQIGLVAQDVRNEFPALVRGGEADALSLSYSKFTAVLLKGLQEQRSVVDSLSNRVRNLEAQQESIERLQARLSRVEADTNGSVIAGVTGSRGNLLIALLLGGLLGAGLLWHRRRM